MSSRALATTASGMLLPTLASNPSLVRLKWVSLAKLLGSGLGGDCGHVRLEIRSKGDFSFDLSPSG